MNDVAPGETALHAAISEGRKDVAEFLIRKGASVSIKNLSGRTPLHFLAGQLQDGTLAQLLIEHGADINAKDNFGETPLGYALRVRNQEVIGVLQKHGAR